MLDRLQMLFWSSSPNNGPLISSKVTVKPYTKYDVQIEIVKTDTDGFNEYAVISLNEKSLGKCYPGGPRKWCTYVTCSNLTKNEIKTDSTYLLVTVHFTIYVRSYGAANCNVNGNQAAGIARITLTRKGKGKLNICNILHISQ